jgi:hypothetical protein
MKMMKEEHKEISVNKLSDILASYFGAERVEIDAIDFALPGRGMLEHPKQLPVGCGGVLTLHIRVQKEE